METESLYQEMKIIIDCMELMDTKVLGKDVKWKKNWSRIKQENKDKKQVKKAFVDPGESTDKCEYLSSLLVVATISNTS